MEAPNSACLGLCVCCGLLSLALLAHAQRLASQFYPCEKEDVAQDTPSPGLSRLIPYICVEFSQAADTSAIASILRRRGFIVLSVLEPAAPKHSDMLFLKVGPKLFPKLAIGLNLPLQPTDSYTQGELNRIYDAAIISVVRAKQATVFRCYLQHDSAGLQKCFQEADGPAVADYFGLEIGLLFDFLSSYASKLLWLALVAVVFVGGRLIRLCLGMTPFSQSFSFFPLIVVVWSLFAAAAWRGRAATLISTSYSGLLLSMLGDSSRRRYMRPILIATALAALTMALAGAFILALVRPILTYSQAALIYVCPYRTPRWPWLAPYRTFVLSPSSTGDHLAMF